MGSGWVTSLAVQWLVGTLPFYCRDMGSIPDRGNEILHAMWCGQKKFFNEEKKKKRPLVE